MPLCESAGLRIQIQCQVPCGCRVTAQQNLRLRTVQGLLFVGEYGKAKGQKIKLPPLVNDDANEQQLSLFFSFVLEDSQNTL